MSKQPPHKYMLIPGPVEFSDEVLEAMAHYSITPLGQPFMGIFQSVLKKLRILFGNKDLSAQAFVIAGGGTMGWDLASANLLHEGDDVLLLNTGFFGSRWCQCLENYGQKVTELKPEIGEIVALDKVESALKSKKFRAIAITHVETSTGVITDVGAVTKLVRSLSPDTLILVDAVCSAGAEPILFDDWGADFILTAPQKAIGSPAGLSISMASKRAIDIIEHPKTRINAFYHKMSLWLPVMREFERGEMDYHVTPPIQLICALNAALNSFCTSEETLNHRLTQTKEISDKVKQTLKSFGIKLVSNEQVAAHGVTAAYLPKNYTVSQLLDEFSNRGLVVSPGLFGELSDKYFRIGHMGHNLTFTDQLLSVMQEIFSSI